MRRSRKRLTKDADAQEDAESSKRACVQQSLTSNSTFDWLNLCLLCGKKENLRKCMKHTCVSQSNSETVKKNILYAADIRKDTNIQSLLAGEINLFSKNARYHSRCYQDYVCKGSLNAIIAKNDGSSKLENVPYEKIANDTVLFYKQKFDDGEFVLLPSMCEHFKTKVIETNLKSAEEAMNIKSGFIKSKLEKITEYKLKFYSYPGKPDIVASAKFSILFLFHKLVDIVQSTSENVFTKSDNFNDSDNVSLHKAAAIVRKEIEQIPRTDTYFLAKEVSLQYSKDFVPNSLQKLICWIIDEASFYRGILPVDDENHKSLLRRTLSISESLIYCSRRKSKDSIIPPFHFGLTLQLHHMFGKKSLIDILNSHGFCCSNDDLRYFLTLAAEKELEKSATVYVPSGLVSRTNGGLLIQEGDDNVDINTETIDGKDTYHAMARVIFQGQAENEVVESERITRTSQKRALSSDFTDPFQVLHYQKPTSRPEPPTFEGALVAVQKLLDQGDNLLIKDLVWAMLRNISRGIFPKENVGQVLQIIPSWVPFNTHFAEIDETFTKVLYIPAINAKPSDLSTVYTTLKRGQELMKACGQAYCIHTFDQQIFALAQYVIFDRHEEFSNVVLRLGGFHTDTVLTCCIGIIWGDSCLRSMLVDSGVYAANTVDQMLQGKQFHRGQRGLTLCYEVLLYLLYENFFEWLSENNETFLDELCDLYTDFHASYSTGICNREAFEKLVTASERLVTLLNEFRELRSGQSTTFYHYDLCVQSLQLLLSSNRSQREGNWKLELSSQVRKLPYFFACNKQNYSRYGTLHVIQMLLTLPEEVENEFLSGNFSVKFTPGSFRGLWSDMAVEMSVIKDTKSDTGIVGLTRKDSTVLRWSVTRNILGAYSSVMSSRSGLSKDTTGLESKHEGERQQQILKDENHFCMMLDYVKKNMLDPFSTTVQSEFIVNMSSGLVATPEIHSFLYNFLDIGKKKLTEFISSRLENGTQDRKKFHDPITQTSIKTFSDSKKKTVVTVNGKTYKKFISPEVIYQRALAVSQNRKDVDLKLILSTPLTAIPSALFQSDGCRRTTDKSDFMHALEREVELEIITQLPLSEKPGIIVIDGMAELQALSSKTFTNFNNLGNIILQGIIYRLKYANEIHLVFDRYDDELSLNPKQEERSRRYGTGGKTYNIHGNGILSNLKKILSNNQNKSSLTEFLCNYLKEHLPKCDIMIQNPNKKVYLSGGLEPRECAFSINYQESKVDLDFSCNHIDADTRLIFHVQVIQRKMDKNQLIIVESPDTDVFLLLLYHFSSFESCPQLWFFTGKISVRTDLRRYIPIHSLAQKLGNNKCSSLLAVHALTGCDTNSSLFYIGKTKANAALQMMSDDELNNLSSITHLEMSTAQEVVSIFASYLYDPKRKSKGTRNDINSLRYHLALEKNPDIARLPPSDPAMHKHILRAIWQMNEWQQAIEPIIISKDVTKFGWLIENGKLSFDYYDGPTAMEILQKYFCSCSGKNACKTDVCPCRRLNLKCCDVCSCNDTCANKDATVDIDEINENC